jgi:hypothetical protein
LDGTPEFPEILFIRRIVSDLRLVCEIVGGYCAFRPDGTGARLRNFPSKFPFFPP